MVSLMPLYMYLLVFPAKLYNFLCFVFIFTHLLKKSPISTHKSCCIYIMNVFTPILLGICYIYSEKSLNMIELLASQIWVEYGYMLQGTHQNPTKHAHVDFKMDGKSRRDTYPMQQLCHNYLLFLDGNTLILDMFKSCR
jgi:hypothetical protein